MCTERLECAPTHAFEEKDAVSNQQTCACERRKRDSSTTQRTAPALTRAPRRNSARTFGRCPFLDAVNRGLTPSAWATRNTTQKKCVGMREWGRGGGKPRPRTRAPYHTHGQHSTVVGAKAANRDGGTPTPWISVEAPRPNSSFTTSSRSRAQAMASGVVPSVCRNTGRPCAWRSGLSSSCSLVDNRSLESDSE